MKEIHILDAFAVLFLLSVLVFAVPEGALNITGFVVGGQGKGKAEGKGLDVAEAKQAEHKKPKPVPQPEPTPQPILQPESQFNQPDPSPTFHAPTEEQSRDRRQRHEDQHDSEESDDCGSNNSWEPGNL